MKMNIFLLVFFALTMTGCLTTSLNSIFSPQDILPGVEIIGKWEIKKDSLKQEYLLISNSPDQRLSLTYVKQTIEAEKIISRDTSKFIGNFGKIHNVFFFEFKPYPNDDKYFGFMIPTYYFVKVSFEKNKMYWRDIPPKKLMRYLENSKIKLRAEYIDNTGSILITDDTKNIQKFLKEVLKKKEFFENSSEYIKVE